MGTLNEKQQRFIDEYLVDLRSEEHTSELQGRIQRQDSETAGFAAVDAC